MAALFPFAFGSVSGRSKQINAERLINLYPETAPRGSKSPVILRSAPGNAQWAVVGLGPIRGWHDMNMSNVRTAFAVSGTDLYEVDSGGNATLRGAAGAITGTGNVSMASNAANELAIVNEDGKGWVWDGTTLSELSTIDADFTDDATNLTFLDQYVIYGKKNTGQVYASDLNNLKSWNALSFGTAESAPDNVTQVFASAGNLWLFGEKTTEIFYNTGASPFAFARIGGAVLQDVGGVKGTVATVEQSVVWLGTDGVVYQATGIQPKRISTHEVENRLTGRTGFTAWAYKEEGHAFYVLGTDEGAEVYDVTTRAWHERTTHGAGRYRANNYRKVYGKHLVGDYHLGLIYEMSLQNYADGFAVLRREAISAPLIEGQDRVPLGLIQVVFDMGVGLGAAAVIDAPVNAQLLMEDGTEMAAENGTLLLGTVLEPTEQSEYDPQVSLEISTDGGMTWGNQKWASIGKMGEWTKRAIWRRLGSKRNRNFKISYAAATPFSIHGGVLK